MTSEVIMEMAEKMDKSLDAFKQELTKIRTGRASLSLLDGIKVEAYGSSMPLNQVGTLTIPESRQIVIQPWDPQVMPSIEKAILKSELSITPVNDGKVIRINIPQLTEERRKELVKISLRSKRKTRKSQKTNSSSSRMRPRKKLTVILPRLMKWPLKKKMK